MLCKVKNPGNSLVVQWLGLHAFPAVGLGSIPGFLRELRFHKLCMWKKKKKKF